MIVHVTIVKPRVQVKNCRLSMQLCNKIIEKTKRRYFPTIQQNMKTWKQQNIANTIFAKPLCIPEPVIAKELKTVNLWNNLWKLIISKFIGMENQNQFKYATKLLCQFWAFQRLACGGKCTVRWRIMKIMKKVVVCITIDPIVHQQLLWKKFGILLKISFKL